MGFQANGHREWNPTVVQMDSGDFVTTYYDYTPGDPGYTLSAIARASVSSTAWPRGTACCTTTIYIPHSTPRVGNASVIRFVPGP